MLMLKTCALNLQLYKILLTIGVLLAFVAASYVWEAVRARRFDRVEVACIAGVLICVFVIGMLVWSSYSTRIA